MKPTPSPILVRHPRRPPLGAALAVTSLLALATGAGAAEDEAMPQKIAPPPDVALQKNLPPSTEGIAKAPPPATDAARKVPPPSNDVAAVQRARVSARIMTPLPAAGELEAPMVLQLLQSGKLTVEQAWQQNLLNVAQVSRTLEKEVRQSGSLLINDDHPGSVQLDLVRRSLAGLLVQHDARFAGLVAPGNLEPEQTKRQQRQLKEISRRVRLWVGEYLLAQQDRRGEAVLSSIVVEAKPPLSFDRQLEAVIAGAVISDFYRRNGDYAKSAALWRSMDEFSDDARLKADLRIGAARDYMSMGDEKKAQQLYEQVPNDQGWVSGLAVYDRSFALIVQNRYREARELLQRPVTGLDADQTKVGMLTLISYSYYRAGDLEKAEKYAVNSINSYKAIQKPYEGVGIEAQVNTANRILDWVQKWKKQAIRVSSPALRLVYDDSQGVTQKLRVSTVSSVPIAVSSNNPNLKVEIRDVVEAADSGRIGLSFACEKEVEIEVKSGTPAKSFDATLTVTIPNFAGAKIQVPVHVEVPDSIQLSSKNVFFGFVKVGEPATAKLTLNAKQPFRILRVESDSAALQVHADVQKFAQEHEVALTLSATGAGRVYEGKIHVVTDLPVQESFDVAYYGAVE